ncbi:MAG: hypothetical protein ACTILL_09770, partial [Lacticaseibacillus paracasei]
RGPFCDQGPYTQTLGPRNAAKNDLSHTSTASPKAREAEHFKKNPMQTFWQHELLCLPSLQTCFKRRIFHEQATNRLY